MSQSCFPNLESSHWERMPGVIEAHVRECDACNHLVTGLREEAQGISVSIGGIWFVEGISCPHRDLLMNWMEGGLDAAQTDYIDFHLNVIDCPICNTAVGQCASELDGTPLTRDPEFPGRAQQQATFFSSVRTLCAN